MTARALLIEPDNVLLSQYGRKLAQHFDVVPTLNAQYAIDALDGDMSRFDLIVMDFGLGQNNGVEFLHEIRSYDDWATIPVVVMSSVPTNRLPLEKLETYGIQSVLYKPQTTPLELLRQATRAIA